MATGYHSVSFDKDGNRKNTWDNWRLIPSSRPVIVQPTPVYKYVDIPGTDSQLDLTNYLIGRPTYSDRKGSLEFLVVNAIWNTQNYGPRVSFSYETAAAYADWTSRRNDIANFLDGSNMKIILEDDPNYYYYGRVFFKEWRSDPKFSKVIIDYQVRPYRCLSNGVEVGL